MATEKRSDTSEQLPKLEAIHLLPRVDKEAVNNYVNELLKKYPIVKNHFTSKCFICASSLLRGWKNIVKHIENPSHINNIKVNSKQYTAICFLCSFILIADDADFIFEHFNMHNATTGLLDYQETHQPLENDLASHSSSNSPSSLILRDVKSDSTKKKYVLQKENVCLAVAKDTFRGIGRVDQHEITLKPNYNIPEVKNSSNCNSVKNSLASGCDIFPDSHNRNEKLSTITSDETASPLQKNINILDKKLTYSNEYYSKNKFHPKCAFFSNATLQLISPGVYKDEFTVSQELNAVNICHYFTTTYYSFYYRLQKIYFSCLECKVFQLKEANFYKHLNGIKHKNKLGNSYFSAFIKICDICQVLLLGDFDLIKEHFEEHRHKHNVKCKLDIIKQQYNRISGVNKLGYSGKLTDRCSSIFSSKEALNNLVESLMEEAREVASLAAPLNETLERDIKKALEEKYCHFSVDIMGSRRYELADHQSDADIYLNIGDVSVGDLEEYFQRAVGLFEVKRTILDAKVPIIILKHLQSSVMCEINTTNPTGSHCSELIKLYISLDDRVRWLVVAILAWGAENDLRGTRKFKSYALLCLILFFLMSPKIRLIPSVHQLKSLYEGTRIYYKGWDYSFCRDIEKIKQMHNPLLCHLNKYELLAEFFNYYFRLDFNGCVIFPHNGEIYRKVNFANPSLNVYPGIHTNKEDKGRLSVWGCCVVIDTFNLRQNVTKTVDQNLLDHFQSVCHKTLLCGWHKKKK